VVCVQISVNRSTPFSQVQKNGPSGSAYVTYYRAEDALRCIEAIDGTVWDGENIRSASCHVCVAMALPTPAVPE